MARPRDGFEGEETGVAAVNVALETSGGVMAAVSGDPIHTGRGLIAAADQDTHARLLELVAPHLEAV